MEATQLLGCRSIERFLNCKAFSRAMFYKRTKLHCRAYRPPTAVNLSNGLQNSSRQDEVAL